LLTNEPTIITAMTMRAARGILNFSGIISEVRTPVWFQTKCMGLVMMVMGTWKKIRRRVIASQRRKGTIHPRSDLWRVRPAIHQL
jgi:hypothetical protein